jgi:hypothetical protein
MTSSGVTSDVLAEANEPERHHEEGESERDVDDVHVLMIL